MTSNGKQLTVTREMLIAVARDQRWPDVVAGISARFSNFAFVLFCYITNHLMTILQDVLKKQFAKPEPWCVVAVTGCSDLKSISLQKSVSPTFTLKEREINGVFDLV